MVNFRELRQREVRRIPLPRTPVNRATASEAALGGIMLFWGKAQAKTSLRLALRGCNVASSALLWCRRWLDYQISNP